MNSQKMVLQALKEKNPALHRELERSGKLAAYISDLDDEINEQIATLTMQIASKNGLHQTPERPYLEKVGILNMADSMATEVVLSEMLEFPQDETSQQNPEEITSSETAT